MVLLPPNMMVSPSDNKRGVLGGSLSSLPLPLALVRKVPFVEPRSLTISPSPVHFREACSLDS
jgi:hypothetical protein